MFASKGADYYLCLGLKGGSRLWLKDDSIMKEAWHAFVFVFVIVFVFAFVFVFVIVFVFVFVIGFVFVSREPGEGQEADYV